MIYFGSRKALGPSTAQMERPYRDNPGPWGDANGYPWTLPVLESLSDCVSLALRNIHCCIYTFICSLVREAVKIALENHTRQLEQRLASIEDCGSSAYALSKECGTSTSPHIRTLDLIVTPRRGRWFQKGYIGILWNDRALAFATLRLADGHTLSTLLGISCLLSY